MLYDILGRILIRPEISESHSKNNAAYSILFEAIALTISFGHDAPETLRDQGENGTSMSIQRDLNFLWILLHDCSASFLLVA